MIYSENQPNTVSVLTSSLLTHDRSPTGSIQVTRKENSNDGLSPGRTGTVRVYISKEAKELQVKEGSSTQKDEAENNPHRVVDKNKSAEAAGESSKTQSEQSLIDQLIKKLQYQIREVKKKIAALANDDSEAAIEQRKNLETQLAQLTSRLLSLVKKKMEMA